MELLSLALETYVEDLKRASNAEACPPLADWAIRRRPADYAPTRKTFLR